MEFDGFDTKPVEQPVVEPPIIQVTKPKPIETKLTKKRYRQEANQISTGFIYRVLNILTA